MTQKTIIASLLVIRPGSQWVIRSEDLSGLEWLDNVQSRPTDDEIIAEITAQGN